MKIRKRIRVRSTMRSGALYARSIEQLDMEVRLSLFRTFLDISDIGRELDGSYLATTIFNGYLENACQNQVDRLK